MTQILRLLWLGVLLAAQAAFAEEPLTIGVFAFRDKAETVKKFQPLADYLERTLPGQRFVLKSYTYDELEKAIERREVDFVLSHAAHYVAIRERNALSSPLATMIEREKNQPMPVYGGAIIVRPDRADLVKLADLRGKTVATSSIKGFASYQMQAYELYKIGLAIPDDVKVIEVELPIDRSVTAVLDGKADAAFVRMGLIEQMAQEGKLDLNRVKVLNPQKLAGFGYAFSTTLYPLWPFVTMPQVSDALAAKVAAALLMLPHDGEVARAARIWGFTIPANYEPVKDVMQVLRVEPFDEAPEFSWRDIWRRYTVTIVIALAGAGIILLLLFWLAVSRRRLATEQKKVRELNETLEQRVSEEVAKNLAQEHLLIQQSRLAAMGEMVGNIAHQWRQPLNALGLLLANVKDANDFHELNTEMIDESVTTGQQLIQNMSNTIDDFRNFFRPNKAKQSFQPWDGIDKAIKLVAESFKVNGIEIVLERSEATCEVIGYPNEFSQVVLNALSNAKEAIVEKKRPGKVHIQVETGAGSATISIRDNGGGIPEDILPRVFDPYFTTKEKGTGIGLYMSKMIMAHMDGDIVIRNIENGAEVLLTLPPANAAV